LLSEASLCDLSEKNYSIDYTDSIPVGFSFTVKSADFDQKINIKNIVGDSYVYPLLASVAVGTACGMTKESIIRGLNAYQPPKGRMNLIPAINGTTLIDDTYNSSPDAVLSALNTLKIMQTSGSKIAVLADMMELGKYSADKHRDVGIATVGSADRLVVVGPRSRTTALEAIKAGLAENMVNAFDNSIQAGEFLKGIVEAGDIVLVKGSQSMRMERVSAMLLREPQKAADLLARQEKEWLDKK